MKTIKLGFTFLFFSIFTISFGQKNYSEGYIITLQNDTIHGKIRDRFGMRLEIAPSKINFIDSTGTIVKYLPKDIKGYSKAGIIDYLTIQDNFGKNFGKLIVDGDVKLLTIKKSGTRMASNPNATGGFTTIQSRYSNDVYYLYNTKTSNTTTVYQLFFKNRMADYFSDYDKLKTMILNKELRYRDLEVIVATYNKWKKEKTPSL